MRKCVHFIAILQFYKTKTHVCILNLRNIFHFLIVENKWCARNMFFKMKSIKSIFTMTISFTRNTYGLEHHVPIYWSLIAVRLYNNHYLLSIMIFQTFDGYVIVRASHASLILPSVPVWSQPTCCRPRNEIIMWENFTIRKYRGFCRSYFESLL